MRAERRAHTEGIAKSHAKRTADLKSFIARFGHGHKKMARQAQSRMKLLERIQGDAVELDYDDPYLKLDFPAAQVMNLRTKHPRLNSPPSRACARMFIASSSPYLPHTSVMAASGKPQQHC